LRKKKKKLGRLGKLVIKLGKFVKKLGRRHGILGRKLRMIIMSWKTEVEVEREKFEAREKRIKEEMKERLQHTRDLVNEGIQTIL